MGKIIMTEHEYQIKEEKLKSSIRSEKIKQFEYDMQSEQERTKQAMHVTNTEKQKTLEAKEDTNISRLKVESKRKDAVLLKHQNTRKNLDANYQNKENALYGKTLDLKYQDLETGYDAAKKMLDNRRELLTQQGLLNNTPRDSQR
jgi:hypothetical protein